MSKQNISRSKVQYKLWIKATNSAKYMSSIMDPHLKMNIERWIEKNSNQLSLCTMCLGFDNFIVMTDCVHKGNSCS